MIKRIVSMTTDVEGSTLYEFSLNDYQAYLYMPASELPYNLINYGFTGPTMTVFADKKLTGEEVTKFAAETGLKQLSQKNGMGLIFVNPKGETWEKEEKGAYEAIASNLAIAQSNFRDGLAIMKNPGAPDEIAYNILGSCVRMYVYAFGTGADYVSQYYLGKVEGQTLLGDLGKADLTMVCCTLVNGKALPAPEKNDLHIVSVGNSPEYNQILKDNCAEVVEREELDLTRDFIEVVGNYRRWRGVVVPAYNYEAEGIVEKAEALMIPVPEDNVEFAKMHVFARPKQHKIGYVTFYDKNLDLNAKHPLMLVFHGGGDSAYATASLAEWPEIGQKYGFITVAVEMHLKVSPQDVCALIDHLVEEYNIDTEKLYATGFSMGGIKSWDLYECAPKRFAALLPMNAIDYVGNNCFGAKTEVVNQDELVPLFFIGGQDSFGVELPCHHERAIQRLEYVSKVNQFARPYEADLAQKDSWEDPQYGPKGDRVEVLHDEAFPDSVYTVHYWDSKDGNCYTALMGVTNHAHEIRPFTNEFAWNFVKKYRRLADGSIQIEE